MTAIFILKKKPPRKRKRFVFLKGRYFVIGGPNDMYVSVFWKTPVSILKNVVLQLFLKYNQSFLHLNVEN